MQRPATRKNFLIDLFTNPRNFGNRILDQPKFLEPLLVLFVLTFPVVVITGEFPSKYAAKGSPLNNIGLTVILTIFLIFSIAFNLHCFDLRPSGSVERRRISIIFR